MLFCPTKVERKLNTKNIYLVRHGETAFNKKGIVQGSGIDASLNETGRKQADDFYKKYKNVIFDKIYISQLKRTYETVSGFINASIPFERLEGLNEINWGVWEGKALSTDGHLYYTQMISRWSNGETDYNIDGGESPEDVQNRQKVAMEYIMKSPEEKTILICMHGRAMRILLATLLEIPLKTMDQFEHQNTGLYHLLYAQGIYSIVESNNLSHIRSV